MNNIFTIRQAEIILLLIDRKDLDTRFIKHIRIRAN